MKVLSMRKNIIKVDLTDEEHDTLFREGLQLYIDREMDGRFKVLPPNSELIKQTKKIKSFEANEEFSDEMINLAFNKVLKDQLDKDKLNCKNTKKTKRAKEA